MSLFEKIRSKFRKKEKTAFRDRRKRQKLNKTLVTDHIAPIQSAESNGKELILVKNQPDAFFLILYILLLVIGTVLAFSAGSAYAEQKYESGFYFLSSHLKHLAVGLFASCIVYIFSKPRYLRMISIIFYAVSLVLLVAVLLFGTTAGGAKRWLNFGAFTLQPSELAKTALILVLSLYLTRYEQHVTAKKMTKFSFIHGFLVPTAFFAVVCVLVAFEKHFSGLIIIAFIGIFMLFLGGVDLRWFAMYPPALLVVVIIMWHVPHSKERLVGWLNKGSDTLADNWQSTQGLYAIGSGGLFGLGFGESKLKYGYVSQPQNDFVFTIVCEELGFFGAAAILLLFAVLLVRGIYLGMRAPDKFTSLVILGITFKLGIHIILNVGVVTGILPNTGISLPFFSSGGSATLTQMIDMGILLGLSRYCTQKL